MKSTSSNKRTGHFNKKSKSHNTVQTDHFKMKSTSQNASKTHCAISLSVYKAFFYAFMAGVSSSVNSVLVRFAKGTPPVQMSLYRFLGMMLFNLPITVYEGVSLIGPKDSRKLLLYRSATTVPTIIFSFMSFRYLPIGEASVIVYSTPVFVTIFARILLKEVCGIVQSVTVGLTVIGIIFIINPLTFLSERNLQTSDHIIGVVCGLAGLFCNCSVIILTRQTKNVHYSVVGFTAATAGTIFCLLLMGTAYDPVLPGCETKRWIAFAIGLSSSVGQLLYIKALQIENAGPISTLKAAADITIAIAWQIGIFQETLDYFPIAGTSLVVICVFLIGLRKRVLMLPKESPMKKTLRFLTY